MNNSLLANSLSVSVRIYRALLVAYPKKFREHYETQMVQVFRDSLKDTYQHHGMPGVIDLWLHTCADLLVTALNERISEGSQYMFSPKVILWGGVASVFSGLFWLVMAFPWLEAGATPLVLAFVLGLGGLAGLYSQQIGQGGRFALVGFVLGITGTGLPLATLWWGSISGRFSAVEFNPTLAAPGVLIISLGILILGLGLVLLGITSLRAKTLHRGRGLPLGLGLLSTLAGMTFWLVYYLPLSQGQNPWNPWNFGTYVLYPVVLSLLGLGWMGLGILLAIEAEAKVVPPPTASA